MTKKHCFFLLDKKENEPIDEAYIRAICVECGNKHQDEKFSYYGLFGNSQVKCWHCQKIIHSGV